jgi:ankyrin repeat protein
MTISFGCYRAQATEYLNFFDEEFIQYAETLEESRLACILGGSLPYVNLVALLYIASQRGLVSLTKCLLNARVGAHLQTNLSDAPDPWTPLHEAVNNDQSEAAKMICLYRPDFMSFIVEYQGNLFCAVSLAIRKGNIQLAEDLLADRTQLSNEACYCILRSALIINLEVFSRFLDMVIACGFNKFDDSELYYEILQSKFAIEAFRLLQQKGACLDARDSKGFTALHHAVFLHHNDAIDYLISLERNGKKIFHIDDFQNQEKMTPITCAVLEGDEDLVRKLLGYGACLYQENIGYLPLHLACSEGFQNLVQILLEALEKDPMFRINEADESRFRAIDSAVEGGRIGVCRILQQHGASCDYHTLCWAAEATPLDRVGSMIQFLVNSYSIDMRVSHGIAKTPLHCLAYRLISPISECAVVEGQLELATTCLLSKGVSILTLDADGSTPLDLANKFENGWFKRAFEVWKASQRE